MKNIIRILTGICLITLMTYGCHQKDASVDLLPQVDKLLAFCKTGNFDGIEDVLCRDFEIRASPFFEAEKGIDTFKERAL